MAFYQDTNDVDSLVLIEEWTDWTSLEIHIRSDSYRHILELTKLSSEQPEIKFLEISSSKGVEFIEKLRKVTT